LSVPSATLCLPPLRCRCGSLRYRVVRRYISVVENFSIRSMAHNVSRWVVVADPHLLLAVGSNSTAHCLSSRPDDLGIMATNLGAGVASEIICSGVARPRTNDLWRGCRCTCDHIQVFAVSVIWPMAKPVRCNQMVGPILCGAGEVI